MSVRAVLSTMVTVGVLAVANPAMVAAAGPTPVVLSAAQRLRADRLVSIFENDTIAIDYRYIEALDDGRGYTAGRAGFTSATGDLLEVVTRYRSIRPTSTLTRFIPRLRQLASTGSGSIQGLSGLVAAWRTESQQASFRQVQDRVVDDWYFEPALGRARSIGITSALGVAILYDTVIQHGDGDDPDGLKALIDETVAAVGRPTGQESRWLHRFLTIRRYHLLHPADPKTADVWAKSVSRVDILRSILAGGNLVLRGPIVIDHPDHHAVIP